MPEPQAEFFRTPEDWRAWLTANAADTAELWVGFFKRGAAESGITWPQAVDQALCFGWIDGRRQSIDATRYRIRFTPRTAKSTWSTVNVARVQELTAGGLMQPAGLEAFARRRADRSGSYSHEQAGEPVLDAGQLACLEQHPEARAFLERQPPSYRKAVLWWVVNAKRPETRARRLEKLIANSAEGRRLEQFQSPRSAR
jgi:uncharacterized protein YdeI (YjbR/CyaY-like superfamily)